MSDQDVTDAAHLIIDNDEGWYTRVKAAALAQIEQGAEMGAYSLSDYRDMLAGRGQMSRSEFSTMIATDVRDVVYEAIDEAIPEQTHPVRLLLCELLGTGTYQWQEIAEQYLPEVDELPEEDNEDEDADMSDFELANI
jgi:hypothetical protein